MRTFIETPPKNLAQTGKTEGITVSDISVFMGLAFPLVSAIVSGVVFTVLLKGRTEKIEQALENQGRLLMAQIDGKFQVFEEKLNSIKNDSCRRDETIELLKRDISDNRSNTQALVSQLNRFGVNVHARGMDTGNNRSAD